RPATVVAALSRHDALPILTLAPDRADTLRRRRIVAEFLAQLRDPAIDRPIEPVVLDAAHPLVELLSTQDRAGRAHEHAKQLEFLRGQRDLFAVEPYPMRRLVHAQAAEHDLAVRGLAALRRLIRAAE